MGASDTVSSGGSSQNFKEECLRGKEVTKLSDPAIVSSEKEQASYSSLTVDESTSSEEQISDTSDDVSKLTPAEVQSILESTKEAGKVVRIQDKQEMMALHKRLTALEGKLKKKLGFTSMATYKRAMKYGQDGQKNLPVPTYVLAHQTQLCKAFHVREVYLDQTKRMQKRNKKLLNYMKHQVRDIREESERREQLLQEKVDSKRVKVVKMCHTLELDPDAWRQEVNILQRFSDVLSVIPGLNGWIRRLEID